MAVKMDREKGKESDSLCLLRADAMTVPMILAGGRSWPRPGDNDVHLPPAFRHVHALRLVANDGRLYVGMLKNTVQNRHFCLDLCSIYIRHSVQQCAGYLTTVFLSWIWAWKYRPDVFTGWMSALCYPSYYVGQLISLRSNGHFSRWMWGSGLY